MNLEEVLAYVSEELSADFDNEVVSCIFSTGSDTYDCFFISSSSPVFKNSTIPKILEKRKKEV